MHARQSRRERRTDLRGQGGDAVAPVVEGKRPEGPEGDGAPLGASTVESRDGSELAHARDPEHEAALVSRQPLHLGDHARII
jgi:hypothetical protein